MKKNWKENKVVQRIIELQKTYVFRHGYAGTSCFGSDVWDMWECGCCGNLSDSTESLYHKDPENMSGISLCPVCSDLWRAVARANADWKPELLKSYSETEIEEWLKVNPKPEHFEGSDYYWMYDNAPEKSVLYSLFFSKNRKE